MTKLDRPEQVFRGRWALIWTVSQISYYHVVTALLECIIRHAGIDECFIKIFDFQV